MRILRQMPHFGPTLLSENHNLHTLARPNCIRLIWPDLLMRKWSMNLRKLWRSGYSRTLLSSHTFCRLNETGNRPWSDCVNAQAELGLRCPHMPEYTFSHGAVQLAVNTLFVFRISEPSCSKLTTSLVNDSLKFASSDTKICWNFLLKKCE